MTHYFLKDVHSFFISLWEGLNFINSKVCRHRYTTLCYWIFAPPTKYLILVFYKPYNIHIEPVHYNHAICVFWFDVHDIQGFLFTKMEIPVYLQLSSYPTIHHYGGYTIKIDLCKTLQFALRIYKVHLFIFSIVFIYIDPK